VSAAVVRVISISNSSSHPHHRCWTNSLRYQHDASFCRHPGPCLFGRHRCGIECKYMWSTRIALIKTHRTPSPRPL